MKIIAKFAIIMSGLAFSGSVLAGTILGGGGMSKSVTLRQTAMLLEDDEMSQFTLLPESLKDTGRENEVPVDLKFVPDDEFIQLQEAEYVQVTDEAGSILKTYLVTKLDETSGILVFVEQVQL